MKDTLGREWDFRFTGRTVRELAAETRLDTKALQGESSLLHKVGTDESTLYLVLWITIRPQAIERGVTEEEWFDALDNDCLQAAAQEWIDAYVNFSHPARKAILHKTMEATRRKLTAAEQQVQKALDSGEIDRVIENLTAIESHLAPELPTSTSSMSLSASMPG